MISGSGTIRASWRPISPEKTACAFRASLFLKTDVQERGPQDMTGLMKTDFDIRADQQTLSRIDRLEKIQTAFRIFDGVKRLHRFLAGADIFSVLPFGFHFLDMGAVPEHDPAEFERWPGCR